MTEEHKKGIYKWVDISLSSIFKDAIDRDLVVDSIFGEVVDDIEQTADNIFNGSDIDIAIARVLKARIVGF
jgi:hypothetical protein